MAAWKSVSRRKRSRKGPTRYFPRCKRRGCVNPLPAGQHIGLCDPCHDEIAALLTGPRPVIYMEPAL